VTARLDLERAKDDWFHGRRHVNCLTCNGEPWAHPGSCTTWVGPTDGGHLDPPCAVCGECEHVHHLPAGLRPRHRCAAFALPAQLRLDADVPDGTPVDDQPPAADQRHLPHVGAEHGGLHAHGVDRRAAGVGEVDDEGHAAAPTGLDAVRAAVRRDRGGDAPNLPQGWA